MPVIPVPTVRSLTLLSSRLQPPATVLPHYNARLWAQYMQPLAINDGVSNGIACTSSSECSAHGIPNNFSDAVRCTRNSAHRSTWFERDVRYQHEHSRSVQHVKDSVVSAVEYVQLLQCPPCQCRSLYNADECLGFETGLYECNDATS